MCVYMYIYMYSCQGRRTAGLPAVGRCRRAPGGRQRECGALCRLGGSPRRSRDAEPRWGRVRLPKRSARRRLPIPSSGEMLSNLGRGSPCHSLPPSFFPPSLQHFSSRSVARIIIFFSLVAILFFNAAHLTGPRLLSSVAPAPPNSVI